MTTGDQSSYLVDPARLAALHSVALLDTPTEQAFDRLTRLAARFVKAPVALVSLVDADRQFFKSSIGLPEPWRSRRETPLSHSFCQYNRTSGQPLRIVDARTHPLLKDNLAIRDLNVIAYLGIPLVTPEGYILGSFCVIDSQPRQWTEEDVVVIQDLAQAVMTEIQLRVETTARKKMDVEHRTLEVYKAVERKILHELNTLGTPRDTLQAIVTILRQTTGLDDVSIRTLVEAHDRVAKWADERTGDLSAANKHLLAEIEEQKRAEESLKIQRDLHSMLRESNEILLLNKNTEAVIKTICEVAVSSGHFSLAWVGFPDSMGQVRIASSSGTAVHYLNAIELTVFPVLPAENESTGLCLHTDCTTITHDFAINPTNANWQERAIDHGLRSSVSIPIHEDFRCIGVFTLYSSLAGFFTSERVALLEQLVANLSSALDLVKASQRQQQTIASLQLSEEKYRIVADNTYDWEFWIDQNGQYIYVSPACERITGHNPEEFKANTDLLEQIIHPEDISTYQAHRHDAQKAHEAEGITFRIRRQDGQERWVEHACQPVFGKDGRYLGNRGSNRDVTARKMTEMLLRESEEKYRNLFNHSEIAMFRSRLDGSGVIDCNTKFLAFVGMTREEVLEKPSTIFWADPKEREAIAQRLFADGSVSEYEIKMQHGRKGVRNCRASMWLSREQGIIEGSVADITEHKMAEAQILQSKKRLQAVFDGILEPLIMIDGEMTMQMVNMAAVHYFEVTSPQDIIGRAYCHGKNCAKNEQCSRCPIPSAISGEKPVTFTQPGPSNPERIESVTVFPIAAENAEGSSAVIRISDITQARMMEKSLLRTEKLASIGVLSSGIAHEINNPNNFIMFNIPVLRRYLGAILPIVMEHAAGHPGRSLFGMSFEEFEGDLFDLTDSIEKGSERIKNIVAELKEFSSLGDQEEALWGNPELTINQAIRIARVQLKNKVTQLEVDIPRNLSHVFFEPRGLEQVIVNLLINAAQAADKEDSWISLKAKIEHEAALSYVIEIADNGCGIDETIIGKIFDPFYTTKPPGVGTGLGLYVCHNLMEKMGGRIDVTSCVGEGSTFRLLLPCNRS